jgi:hypothetical protein
MELGGSRLLYLPANVHTERVGIDPVVDYSVTVYASRVARCFLYIVDTNVVL